MFKKLKKNWKNLAIIIVATFIISVAKANLKNGTSLAYSLSNEIYQFAGHDKLDNKLTIAQRVKQEADYCKDGYVVSDWTFEKEAQLYRSNTIYGCPSNIYDKHSTKCEHAVNIKTLNNAYNGNYILEDSWWQDLYLLSSTKEHPKLYECNFNDGEICPEIAKYWFFKFQIFCSIQGVSNPIKCEEIIEEAIRKPKYIEYNNELVEVKRSLKQAREDYINQIVKNRNPIINLKFIIIREKDDRFLRAIMMTDLSDENSICEGNIGKLRLLKFAEELE